MKPQHLLIAILLTPIVTVLGAPVYSEGSNVILQARAGEDTNLLVSREPSPGLFSLAAKAVAKGATSEAKHLAHDAAKDVGHSALHSVTGSGNGGSSFHIHHETHNSSPDQHSKVEKAKQFVNKFKEMFSHFKLKKPAGTFNNAGAHLGGYHPASSQQGHSSAGYGMGGGHSHHHHHHSG